MAITRDGARRAAAELIVEDLQRQEARIAGSRHGTHEVNDRQVSFARHVAEVSTPVERIHLDQRRVGQLDDENAIARDRPDGVDVDLARQRVKTVEDQTDRRMVGAAHDFPGIAMVIDVTAPGQRFVSHTQSAPSGAFAKLVEVGRRAVDAPERRGETLEQASMRSVPSCCMRSNFRSARSKVRARCGSGMPSKSRKGWNRVMLQPVVEHHRARLRGRAIECE